MATVKKTITFPERLWNALATHAKEVGYETPQELVVWCAFYSLVVGKPHTITAPIAQASKNIQDMFIEDVVAAYERGDLRKGSYLEHVLEDVVKRFNLPVGPEVVKAILADAVRNRPKRA